LDPAVVDEMMADLADGLERLKAIGVMVEQAYLRVLAAGAAAASRSPA